MHRSPSFQTAEEILQAELVWPALLRDFSKPGAKAFAEKIERREQRMELTDSGRNGSKNGVADKNFRPTREHSRPVFNESLVMFGHFHQAGCILRQTECRKGAS